MFLDGAARQLCDLRKALAIQGGRCEKDIPADLNRLECSTFFNLPEAVRHDDLAFLLPGNAQVFHRSFTSRHPVIGSRAFSSDAETVAQWGRFQAQAISRAGLLNCGKHFPGHGATKEDSHCRLARLDCDEKTLTARDLHPFQKTVSDLDSIMVGHIWLQSVDAEPTPASLSINVTTGILRDKLGFGKLVVTDDMTMGAVSAAVDIGNACVKAFLAGCDLLLVCSNIDEIEQAHRALSQAVDSGLISAERLELSLQRISSALKPVASWVAGQTACSRKETTRELASLVGQFSGESKELSQGAVTLLRGSVPDLNQGRWVVLVPDHPRYPLNLANYIKALLPADKRNNIHEIRYAQNPGSEEISSLAQATESKDCLFVTFRSAGERQILELGREIARTCNIKVHIPADSPFDVIATPDWDSCLCAYDPSDQGMRALAAVLSGTMSATGTCPVDLSLELPVHGQGRSD